MNRRLRLVIIGLAALAGVVSTLSLGLWQLRRAAYKENLAALMQSRAALPVLPQDALQRLAADTLESHIQQRTQLRGRWLAEHTIALDNRQMRDKPGFFILTPLQLEGAGPVVMVQRGWLARNFLHREQLLPFQTPVDVVDVAGTITLGPSRLYDFQAAENGRIRQNLVLADFRGERGLPLLDFMVVQQGPASDGLLRDWPAPNLGIERHYGYAFQWFSLSVLIAGLYLWFQWIRPLRRTKDDTLNDPT